MQKVVLLNIEGVIKPSMKPKNKGLFLLDIVPDGQELWGFPNVNDSSEIIELISCGAQIILFVTGRGLSYRFGNFSSN